MYETEKVRDEATLRGDRLQRDRHGVRDLSAAAEWNNQRLDIAHYQWSDDRGSIVGSADWNWISKVAKFQIQSSLDLKAFLDAFGLGEPLKETEFHAPPLIEIGGSINLGAEQFRPDVIGHATFGSFMYKNVPFTDLSADFSWDGERTFVHQLRVRHQTGQLRADVLDSPGDFRLNVESTVSPDAIRPVLPADASESLREWQWQRSPTIRMTIRGM